MVQYRRRNVAPDAGMSLQKCYCQPCKTVSAIVISEGPPHESDDNEYYRDDRFGAKRERTPFKTEVKFLLISPILLGAPVSATESAIDLHCSLRGTRM